MKYNKNLSWSNIKDDQEAQDIVKKHLPAVQGMLAKFNQMETTSFSSLGKYAPEMFPAEAIEALDRELQEYGKDKGPSPYEIELMKKFKDMEEERITAWNESRGNRGPVYSSFNPGEEWLDTTGFPIQAHGGYIYFENDTYYWYGENKEFTTGIVEDPENKIWTWGIRCYKSTDLYNWEDMGLIIPPVLDDPDSNLFPTKYADRPHLLKCDKTGKYIMWVKISGSESCFTILEADQIAGPYKIIKENYQPLNISIGDYDFAIDQESKKAYIYVDDSHRAVSTILLDDTYTQAVEKVASQYQNLFPPICREGLTMFENQDKKYMITSGTTGYTPNQCDCAVASSWDQEFKPIGDPHVGDNSLSSFNTQPSCVFVDKNTGKYIIIADRWMPNHMLKGDMAMRYRAAIASRYQPDKYQANQDDMNEFNARPDIARANTSISRYVWLPLEFNNDKVEINWHDQWSL